MTNIAVRDASIYVEVVGQGYPLLLMHGGPGLDHTTLLPLKACADQFTMIFYDHRCSVRSDGTAVTTMTWDNLTADAEALRARFGFDRWAVLGHSFGGNVALEYALRYPQHLSHLILMNTGGDARLSRQNALEILAKRGYSPEIVQVARRFYNGQLTPDEVLPSVLKFLGAYAYRPGLMYNPTFLALATRLGFGPPMKMRPEAHVYGFSQLLSGWSVMDRLHEITVPTLVLAGRHDFLFPPESQAILADRLPNARLELVECAGHNPQIEQTAEVVRVLKEFMGTGNAVCA